MVAVADGSLRVVKSLDPGQLADARNMWFSPDGRYIVYDVLPSGSQTKRDLAVISVDGTLQSSLIECPADDYALGWSPDGQSIVFASDRSGAYGVWAIPVSEGKPAGEPLLLKRDVGPIRPLGLTRDGVLFYAQAGSMMAWDQDIYSVNVDLDQGTIEEPRLAVQSYRGVNMLPDWSPDGRYLAYVSGRPDSKSYVLSIRDERTGEEREIHPELARFENIRWSPDGQSFLAQGQDREQHAGLFLIDARTGNVRSLLRGEQVTGACLDAQWLPDGRRIVYATNSRRPEVISRIVVRDLETGNEQEILRMADLRLIGFLALSPDGRRLAFTAFRLTGGTDGGAPTNVALMVIPASGGGTTELLQVKFPEMIGNLAWSQDLRSVLFVRQSLGGQGMEQGSGAVWQIPAAGGEPRELRALPNQWQRQRLSFRPDGRRIAYTRASRRFEIWVMVNLLPKPATDSSRYGENQ
jgi:Tol biopolymer transport system component